jgi:membrane protease YdiL (CAAX protease family)
MDQTRLWTIVFGVAWVPVAAAILGRVLPTTDSRVLDRGTGARCLFGALLGIALLWFLLVTTNGLADLPRTVTFLAVHACMGGFLLAFASRVSPSSGILGLEARRAPGDLGRGLLTYLAFAPIVVAAHDLNAWLVGDSAKEVQRDVRDMLLQEGPARIILVATLVVAVPLFEEIVFRGLLQQGIKAQLAAAMPARPARILSIATASVLFTVLHSSPTYLPVFVLSLLLGTAFEKSGRILVPVALHATHNLAVVLYETFADRLGAAP